MRRTARRLALVMVLAGSAAPGAASAAAPAGRGGLAEQMRDAGLERVEPLTDSSEEMRGLLPGAGELRVLLIAGCGDGTVENAVAADAAAIDAALEAASDLARTPRRHTLELVLCSPYAESLGPDHGARSWLSRHPEAAARDRVLAALELQGAAAGGGKATGRATALAASGSGAAGWQRTPAWLAHAALSGARAAGRRLAFGGPAGSVAGATAGSLPGQLLARYGRPVEPTGAGAFLAAGIPALSLAGGGAGDWPELLAGIVRRLDGLAGRPRDDDAYLALGGRIWSRRDLYWAGLAVWVALLATGLPGSWRGAGSSQRRRRGRRYLPGFAFRMLLLVLLLLEPAATLLLLAPAALLTLPPARRRAAAWAARALAAVPTVVFAGTWLAQVAARRMAAWPAQPLRLALVLACLALAISLIGRPSRDAAEATDNRETV